MKLYIIGICGTFMGGVARLARDLGWEVSGSDANTYPPMSTQLESLGISLHEGYRAENVDENADVILIGNTISRGNPELERVLDKGLCYTSGAEWLHDHVLQGRWVLAVAGTHGKTTTSSILAWLLQDNQLEPGFLIGGVPQNFGESARLGDSPFFVIEADEYDTAFSDKRSKFVHYHPRTLVLNNLEYDHADIFPDLGAIQTQFHHLMKIVPQHALVIHNRQSNALQEVLEMGCWSEISSFGDQDSDWQCRRIRDDASEFEVVHDGQAYSVTWPLIGDHNMLNAVAAIAAAHHAGVPVEHAAASLAGFESVKRRLEKIFDDGHIRVYDDFAHHPTAISETLAALRSNVADERILAVLEPRSNTMKQGVHKDLLADALRAADRSLVFVDKDVQWDIGELNDTAIASFESTDALLQTIVEDLRSDPSAPAHVLIMSNGGFENLHQRLITQLASEVP